MEKVQEKAGVLLVTTPTVENHPVTRYYGMVNGRAVFAVNFMKDMFAKVTDTIGGRSRSYESMLEAALETALLEMAVAARKMGANAVLGVSLTITEVGGRMMVAACYGTAVRVQQR